MIYRENQDEQEKEIDTKYIYIAWFSDCDNYQWVYTSEADFVVLWI